jgi:hypothetical protein
VKESYLREIVTTIILLYIPRIIGYTVFLYEIVINKKLELFYYIAGILLIP